MAAYEERTKTIVRHEYYIPSGSANWTELSKAFTAAVNAMERAGVSSHKRTADDAIWVEPDDEGIIIFWTED